jgi:hypothetical protein
LVDEWHCVWYSEKTARSHEKAVRDMQICKTELKRLMRLWFANTARLLFWQRDEAVRELETQLMSLFLEICGKEAYHSACMECLDATASAQTVADCSMLKLSSSGLTRENASFFDMRADSLKHYQISEQQTFDGDILFMDTAQAIIEGDPGALRLGALLNWLPMGKETSADAAIRYWTVLAYTGELFPMQALEYAYTKQGCTAEAALWRAVSEIFREADRRYTITIPADLAQSYDEKSCNVAQVILAVRRCCMDDNQELLPIPRILYAIDSEDDVYTKLENLYAPPEAYHSLLVRQSRKNTIRGFAP